MKIAELNHLENVNESSLVNGGSSPPPPPLFPFPQPQTLINVTTSVSTWAEGFFAEATSVSNMLLTPNSGHASSHGTASSGYGIATSSSSVSGSVQTIGGITIYQVV
ncbi:hypothetical protein AFK68_26185 [Hydrocoleum sp. CS-953]|uniref:hypothetical protein n=1 Tax=Hydrocoleum sp. CS-953 TaxID=1671698 RepID=UPI000B9A288C|nr:hypothetical protein [Hydrocoleum sp. CS-953]OZH52158.1 hypothetical protein AFK68_26185 [Hydrocoleum sp. CS-953]